MMVSQGSKALVGHVSTTTPRNALRAPTHIILPQDISMLERVMRAIKANEWCRPAQADQVRSHPRISKRHTNSELTNYEKQIQPG
jgi:hypothetical protein